jgi:hypothetical protein
VPELARDSFGSERYSLPSDISRGLTIELTTSNDLSDTPPNIPDHRFTRNSLGTHNESTFSLRLKMRLNAIVGSVDKALR